MIGAKLRVRRSLGGLRRLTRDERASAQRDLQNAGLNRYDARRKLYGNTRRESGKG